MPKEWISPSSVFPKEMTLPMDCRLEAPTNRAEPWSQLGTMPAATGSVTDAKTIGRAGLRTSFTAAWVTGVVMVNMMSGFSASSLESICGTRDGSKPTSL